MRQHEDAPHGATGAGTPQTGKAVLAADQTSGWRKQTPALGMAEQLANAGEQQDIHKTRAFVAVKRVGAKIGLKAGDMLLLDTLGAFTQAQDWTEGQRPIVWASNAYLMEQTGFSLSALKRHARRLAELGVISFRDSPNGKRWGRRDAEGRIVEAYGFDLSPLAARAAEFEQLHAHLQAERALCQRLKRQITVARRMIRARIEAAINAALSGPWAQLVDLFEQLLGQLPRRHDTSDRLGRLFAWFRDLQAQVEQSYLAATQVDEAVENAAETPGQLPTKAREMDPKRSSYDPHTPTTKQLEPVGCNPCDTGKTSTLVPHMATETPQDRALKDRESKVPKVPTALNLSTVLQACPEFASWARHVGGFLKTWNDLHRVAGQLRPMIGVTEHAWNVAQDRLGKQAATAALALVFEKHSTGEVASPGGYLRGMVEKAGAGELHLERSFYGRLGGRAA
ncbi:replication protein C [Pseudooceanicola sp. 216_PA32_1]|uniref:Replication protein C n=2 Tax=Pseudooceanicola pacificus TaxID=2676438 RepID=A0A844WD29_9RHOB|nr:replication protein C [Pseudooceanicola pacificus]